MRVLVGCEFSGIVREAFRRLGHDAWSCDLLPSEDDSPYHMQCDVSTVLDRGWDQAVFHPPCTYLCSSGLHWNKRRPDRASQTEDAVRFFMSLANAPIPRIAIENPVGCMSTRHRKPDQIIQPWMFGHDASKGTCLWLKGLPKLIPTNILQPARLQSNGRPQWGNMTPGGQNKLSPSEDRWKLRSLTYLGIASAMADQWTVGSS